MRDCQNVVVENCKFNNFLHSAVFLENECKKAYEAATTPQCREKCSACGANKLNGGKCDAMCKSMVQ